MTVEIYWHFIDWGRAIVRHVDSQGSNEGCRHIWLADDGSILPPLSVHCHTHNMSWNIPHEKLSTPLHLEHRDFYKHLRTVPGLMIVDQIRQYLAVCAPAIPMRMGWRSSLRDTQEIPEIPAAPRWRLLLEDD